MDEGVHDWRSAEGEDTMSCRNSATRFSNTEIADLLERANKLGHSLEKGSPLEQLTIRELEQLVLREERAAAQRNKGWRTR